MFYMVSVQLQPSCQFVELSDLPLFCFIDNTHNKHLVDKLASLHPILRCALN